VSCSRRCSSCARTVAARTQHQHDRFFLQKWLLPRLPQFHDRHPHIELSIHTSRDPVDFAQGDFHAALRMVPHPRPRLYNEKLLDELVRASVQPRTARPPTAPCARRPT